MTNSQLPYLLNNKIMGGIMVFQPSRHPFRHFPLLYIELSWILDHMVAPHMVISILSFGSCGLGSGSKRVNNPPLLDSTALNPILVKESTRRHVLHSGAQAGSILHYIQSIIFTHTAIYN